MNLVYILLSEKSGGVYAAMNNMTGQKVVQIFLNEDDAERFRLLLEADDKHQDLEVQCTEQETVINNCKVFGYSYSIIDSDEFIIPT
jgi:hypothetical protein